MLSRKQLGPAFAEALEKCIPESQKDEPLFSITDFKGRRLYTAAQILPDIIRDEGDGAFFLTAEVVPRLPVDLSVVTPEKLKQTAHKLVQNLFGMRPN